MERLIDKSRKLNQLLQKDAGMGVSFMEMAELLRNLISADIYVISRKGKLLGTGLQQPGNSDGIGGTDNKITPELNSLLFSIGEPAADVEDDDESADIPRQIRALFSRDYLMVVPIIGKEQRVGTLLLSRDGQAFALDEMILAEYGATIIGLEISRGHEDENESEARSRAAVQAALSSLSYSEFEAVEHIFEELSSRDGLLVASKIADKAGITRSVIVNALRKLESAGVIETRSLGMKGTYIKVLNDRLLNELVKNDLKVKV